MDNLNPSHGDQALHSPALETDAVAPVVDAMQNPEASAPKAERKIGIWGINEPLGVRIAELLLESGVRGRDIVGICTQYNADTRYLKRRGVELHLEEQTPKHATGLAEGRVFGKFLFIPTSDLSPRSLQGAVTRYLGRSVGSGRQIREFVYLGPIYDLNALCPAQMVYPAMETSIATKAHMFTILRHAPLLDDVFDLSWLEAVLAHGQALQLLKHYRQMSLVRVDEVAEATLKVLNSSMPAVEGVPYWKSEAGRGQRAILARPDNLCFSSRDITRAFQTVFSRELPIQLVEEEEAERICLSRGIRYKGRNDNSIPALNSLLMLPAIPTSNLLEVRSRHLASLIGEERIDSLQTYFEDLRSAWEESYGALPQPQVEPIAEAIVEDGTRAEEVITVAPDQSQEQSAQEAEPTSEAGAEALHTIGEEQILALLTEQSPYWTEVWHLVAGTEAVQQTCSELSTALRYLPSGADAERTIKDRLKSFRDEAWHRTLKDEVKRLAKSEETPLALWEALYELYPTKLLVADKVLGIYQQRGDEANEIRVVQGLRHYLRSSIKALQGARLSGARAHQLRSLVDLWERTSLRLLELGQLEGADAQEAQAIQHRRQAKEQAKREDKPSQQETEATVEPSSTEREDAPTTTSTEDEPQTAEVKEVEAVEEVSEAGQVLPLLIEQSPLWSSLWPLVADSETVGKTSALLEQSARRLQSGDITEAEHQATVAKVLAKCKSGLTPHLTRAIKQASKSRDLEQRRQATELWEALWVLYPQVAQTSYSTLSLLYKGLGDAVNEARVLQLEAEHLEQSIAECQARDVEADAKASKQKDSTLTSLGNRLSIVRSRLIELGAEQADTAEESTEEAQD